MKRGLGLLLLVLEVLAGSGLVAWCAYDISEDAVQGCSAGVVMLLLGGGFLAWLYVRFLR